MIYKVVEKGNMMGSGAFFKTREEAQEYEKLLKSIYKKEKKVIETQIIETEMWYEFSTRYLRISDMKEKLRVSSLTISRMVNEGKLPEPTTFGEGGTKFWNENEVERFFEKKAKVKNEN